MGSVFKTYDTFNDYFISEETINKLKAIYLKYSTNKSELNDDEKKFLKLFFTFDMDNDSKIESSFLSLNVYIPTEQNKDIANAKIQEFLTERVNSPDILMYYLYFSYSPFFI